MSSEQRRYTKGEINRAGDILRLSTSDSAQKEWAEGALTYWRSLHTYPVNTFQSTLRHKLRTIDPDALVAQRLKRTPSIIGKLRRIDGMRLARMQDIVGLRAVVRDIQKVRELKDNYLSSIFQHELVRQDDYIDQPKTSGYRSVHLVYKYKNSKVNLYDGMHVEIQMRTKLQHLWATSVEVMGTFLNHSLKSSEGPQEWLTFFALTSAAFACLEDCPIVPGYENMSVEEIFSAVTSEASRLNVFDRLDAFTIAVNQITSDAQPGGYHLVTLNIEQKTVSIESYGRRRLEQANKEYTDVERKILDGEPLQAVLVYAGSIEALRRAYPNYFLDTNEFLNQLQSISGTIFLS